MPAFARSFRAAEARLWLLCRNFCDFRLISGQGVRRGRSAAARAPLHCHKYGPAVNPQVMKRLPESGLLPLLLLAFSGEAGTGPRPETRLDVRLPPISGVAQFFVFFSSESSLKKVP